MNKKQKHPDPVSWRHQPSARNQAIEERLSELVKPAVFSPLTDYKAFGMRDRILTVRRPLRYAI